MKVTAIVLAGGKGSRMNKDVAKQYLSLCGKPLLLYSLECFEKSEYIDDIILVVPENEKSFCREEIISKTKLTKLKVLVSGGKERYDSVINALCEAESGYVFIHDGARPFVTEEIIKELLETVKLYRACATGVKVTDTIKKTDESNIIMETVDRSSLWQIQTPQVFDTELIKASYAAFMEASKPHVTDDTMVVELFGNHKVKMVEGSYNNIKITTPIDMLIAEQIIKTEV